jgi:hypothetical protein
MESKRRLISVRRHLVFCKIGREGSGCGGIPQKFHVVNVMTLHTCIPLTEEGSEIWNRNVAKFVCAAILFYLILRRQPCLALWKHVRLFSGTPTSTNSYDGSLPPPFSFTYSYGGTAATVPLPQRHFFCTF